MVDLMLRLAVNKIERGSSALLRAGNQNVPKAPPPEKMTKPDWLRLYDTVTLKTEGFQHGRVVAIEKQGALVEFLMQDRPDKIFSFSDLDTCSLLSQPHHG
jgi:hypothetical protein